MAVSAYVGLPGSGKSYNVVAHVVLPALKAGRFVYTNIPLTDLAYQQYGGLIRAIDMDEWVQQLRPVTRGEEGYFAVGKKFFREDVDLDECVNGSVFIFDEAWKLFAGGTNQDALHPSLRSFFTEHRHRTGSNGHTNEIVLCVQDLALVCKFARLLVDRTYHHKKLDKVGAPNRFRVSIFEGGVENEKLGTRHIDQRIGSYRSKVYRYYKSQSMSSTGLHGDERSTDKRGSIWRSSQMMGLAAVFVVAVSLVLWLGVPLYDRYYGDGTAFEELRPEAVEASPVEYVPPADAVLRRIELNQQRAVAPARPVEAATSSWRIAGVIYFQETSEEGVAILSRQGAIRRVPLNQCQRFEGATEEWFCQVEDGRATGYTGGGRAAPAPVPRVTWSDDSRGS